MGTTEGTSYSLTEYILLFGAVVSGSFVMVSVLLIISTIAKDVKQATTISPILLFVIMIPSLLSSSEGFSEKIDSLGTANYLIPVWNSIKTLKDVVKVEYTAQSVTLTILVNITAAVLGIFIVGRLFNREKIVNG